MATREREQAEMASMEQRLQTTEFHNERCPRCGSLLLTNGDKVWCSFVGGHGKTASPACTFGLDAAVQVAKYRSPYEPSAE